MNSRFRRFWTNLPLYNRIGYGLVVAFAMVGSCLGRAEQAVLVFLVVSLAWVSIRILQEALQAWQLLMSADKEPPESPPTA